ncbi:MAG: hypothetical protein BKP49_10450 [Treponema sp. CETP13]|nr:MAG: hypothetical protein BKP49_10450 [Treponema sp. CETP13]
MDLLISIKPEYVQKIIAGEKKIEYRRRIFKNFDVERIYIYVTAPEKKIVGYFLFDKVIIDTPSQLWQQTNSYGGIQKKDYFNYFEGRDIAYGIEINSFIKFEKPFDPYLMDTKFYPPQSYKYLQERICE